MKPAAFLRGSLWLTLGLFLVTSASAQQPPPSPPVPEPAKPESPAGPRLGRPITVEQAQILER
jgi:hypothetical protein